MQTYNDRYSQGYGDGQRAHADRHANRTDPPTWDEVCPYGNEGPEREGFRAGWLDRANGCRNAYSATEG